VEVGWLILLWRVVMVGQLDEHVALQGHAHTASSTGHYMCMQGALFCRTQIGVSHAQVQQHINGSCSTGCPPRCFHNTHGM
jgi:hypothetical protein